MEKLDLYYNVITEKDTKIPSDFKNIKTFIFFGNKTLRKNSKEYKTLQTLINNIYSDSGLDLTDMSHSGFYFLNKYYYDENIITNNFQSILKIVNNFKDEENAKLYLNLIHGISYGEFKFVKNDKDSVKEFYQKYPPKNKSIQLFSGVESNSELINLVRYAKTNKRIFVMYPYNKELEEINKDDKEIFFVDCFPYHIDNNENHTVKLDSFFGDHGVNLIKLNNKHELEGLLGSIATLIEYQPVLVLNLDLKIVEEIKIPEFLMQIGVDYKFFISYYDQYNDLNNITLYAFV